MKKQVKVVLLAMVLLCLGGLLFAQGEKAVGVTGAGAAANLEASLKVDTSVLKAADGQPLLRLSSELPKIPTRPANPEALPDTDPLRWFDMEYAGWDTKKTNIPASPKDGAIGKRVVMIVHGDHPWTTACSNGAKKVADAYGMDLKILSPNWDLAVQNQMIDQSINERPDMILIIPLDATTAIQQARRINQSGIPFIFFNTLPTAEAMNYAITWTGPDDFGQMRKLAKVFADEMRRRNPGAKELGIAYVQHAPGGSPYFARSYGPLSELAGYAPEVVTLDMQAPGFEADRTMQLVSDWLTRFGPRLKGIFAADDSAQALGIIEALKKAGRDDIVVVAAGNSKIGMDMVTDGSLFAITYQTAEGDGALAVQTAADWFNGKELPNRRDIPQHIITKADVADFYPPQW
ncbi:MAG: sugar ABC transporter substrate-binding protein [Sphaerochaetaceae bacterium]|nr:sugar ABC transporter substrate-binding protein [Sphaerochaetaceae bacterium]MDD4219909.1 sugar ABC transporter substrate-binding protein [Sphaerochaetaceae bacterium]